MIKRLIATFKLDTLNEWRNKLHAVGIGTALITAAALHFVLEIDDPGGVLPSLFLFAGGSTTLVYVGAMIVFERDEGTLDAVVVSPLRHHEYLTSKVVTLTVLTLIEKIILLLLLDGFDGYNMILFLSGALTISAMMILLGFVMIVRFESITDFLMPMMGVLFILQLPLVYFNNISETDLWLAFPTAAPTMLMWGAWHEIETWKIVYGFGYAMLIIGGLYLWAERAFQKFIILKERG